jgi:hypothetical protein
MRKHHRHMTLLVLVGAMVFHQPSAFAQEEDVLVDTAPVEQAHERFDSGWQVEMQPITAYYMPDSVIKKYRAQDDYWYANYRPVKHKLKQQEETSATGESWLSGLIWFLLIAVFFGALTWYLMSSNIRIFRKKSETVGEGGEHIEEDIFEIDYDHDIKKAIADSDYRTAIRLYYLRTLRELSERGLILYHDEKTNSEYLNQLSGTSYYRDFFRLTRDFEYTWYGKFQLSATQFELIQKDFSHFKQGLS